MSATLPPSRSTLRESERGAFALSELIGQLVEQGRQRQAWQVLMLFRIIQEKVEVDGTQAILNEIDLVLQTPGDLARWQCQDLSRLQAALRLSAAVVTPHPDQLAGQVLGRLLPRTQSRHAWWGQRLRAWWRRRSQRRAGLAQLLSDAAQPSLSPLLRPLTATLHAPDDPLIQSFMPHQAAITDIALTADGRYLLTASRDGTVVVTERETARVQQVFSGHRPSMPTGVARIDAENEGKINPVERLALARDGQTVFSWGTFTHVRAWSLLTGYERAHFFPGHHVEQMAASADGTMIAIASRLTPGNTSGVYHVATAALAYPFAAPSETHTSVAVSSDNRWVVWSQRNGEVVLAALATGSVIWRRRPADDTRDRHGAVAFTSDNQAVIAITHNMIGRYAITDGTLLTVITPSGHVGHLNEYTRLLTLPNPRYLLTEFGGQLIVWDLRLRCDRWSFHPHASERLIGWMLSADAHLLATATAGEARIWNFAQMHANGLHHSVRDLLLAWIERSTPRVLGILARALAEPTTRAATTAIACAADGRSAIVAHGRRLYAYDLQSGLMTRHITALTLWENLAATAKRKQGLRAYLLGHHRPATTILIAGGGAAILSAAESVHVRTWRSGWLERVCGDYPGPINALALTPDGQYLIGGGGHDMLSPPDRFPLYVWDWRSGERVLELAGHEGIVTAVVVTPDGRTVISGSRPMGALSAGRPQPAETIHIWDRGSGSLVSSLRNHADITTLALDPTGERLISGSANGSIVVWDVTQTRPAYVLGSHGGSVNAIVVTPDGRLVLTVSADKTVRAWNLTERRCVASAFLNDQVLSCVLTPDGRQALVGTLDGALHRFALMVD